MNEYVHSQLESALSTGTRARARAPVDNADTICAVGAHLSEGALAHDALDFVALHPQLVHTDYIIMLLVVVAVVVQTPVLLRAVRCAACAAGSSAARTSGVRRSVPGILRDRLWPALLC